MYITITKTVKDTEFKFDGKTVTDNLEIHRR